MWKRGSVDYANVKSGQLMERIVGETCGEEGVKRGDGVLLWPAREVRSIGEEEVEKGCWTWEWRV